MTLWYLSRGTGAVALLLLTATVVLGVVDVARWRSAAWPRFVIDALHGTLALTAVAVVAIHVVTSAIDPFAPVRLSDAVVPFAGRYRPLWVGLGAVAFDLLLAIVITSLARRRLGVRAWRAVHWAAYACWPPALAHALGTGSDVRGGWMLVLGLACMAAVVAALATRASIAAGPGAVRAGAVVAAAAGVLALLLWLPRGPLAPGWARRAGTPPRLLRAAAAPRPAPLPLPLTARARGTLRSGLGRDGTALIDIALRLRGARLDVRLAGEPLPGGGVRVARSQVTFGPPSDPARYVGRVTILDDTRLEASVRPLRGRPVRLRARLELDNEAVAATVSARETA